MSTLFWFILGFSQLAEAAEPHLVRPGERVEDLAGGDAAFAEAIRAGNGLAPGAQPKVGDLLWLPDRGGADQEATIVSVAGEVWVRASTGQVAGNLCDSLVTGDTLCTGPASYATVRLARVTGSDDFDDVNLFPGTCLTVRAAHARPDRRASWVSVSQGGVAVHRNGALPGVVTVETPSGLTSGDAGGYRVTIEEKAARTEAIDAPVAVLGGGVEVQVAAGQGTRVKPGEAPSAPVTLLSGSAPIAPADASPLRVPNFQWTPDAAALGYRVEIAADPDFRDVLHQEDLSQPSWSPDVLFLSTQLPAWHWRVAPFDRMGFQGLPGPARSLSLPAGLNP